MRSNLYYQVRSVVRVIFWGLLIYSTLFVWAMVIGK